MKVYVVLWNWNYGERTIRCRVFSNLDLAEEYVDTLNTNPTLDTDTVNIICRELDEKFH